MISPSIGKHMLKDPLKAIQEVGILSIGWIFWILICHVNPWWSVSSLPRRRIGM